MGRTLPRVSQAPSGGGTGGVNGEVADEGNKPVTTKTQVGSAQPAIVEGNAGGFAAVVGSTRAIKGSTVLPAPPLAVPVAKEFVIVPTGKLEPGTDFEGKLTNVAFAPAKAPTALFVPPIALPVAAEASMLPKFAPTNSADDVTSANACDGTVCDRLLNRAEVHSHEAAEIALARTGYGSRGS